MILIQGKGVSGGAASGPLYFLRRAPVVIRTAGKSPDAEKSRFSDARQQTIAQLESLAERGREEAGEEAALLFEIHAMLVEDEDFLDFIFKFIDSGFSAEHAVQTAGEQFACRLASMDDPYMQARAADIRDVARRLVNSLTGTEEYGIDSDEPVILAADDLAPSETIRLDKSRILAFATQFGSGSSHTAILARSMGIPAVCGLGSGLKDEFSGRTACVDGETGQLIVDPDESVMAAIQQKRLLQQETRQQLAFLIGQEDVTPDGQRIDVCCNIGAPEDVQEVLANDGRGIGLFRSEFLYLAGKDFPGEEEQFQAYKRVAEAMNGRRVVIRTLDAGADKQADYFGMPKEENPALGIRAVRFCLNRPEIFRPQLRALYRASAFGKIAILFPMIASVWEVRECRRLCREVIAELEAEGLPCNPDTELGTMIETPASVLIADALAKEVDFFSVGTNDLTQYILACDRQCSDPGRFYDPHHPAVLRALKLAADAAHAAGIWIGVCGELAADPKLLPTFLSLGIDELSVTPSAVLPLRMQIRQGTKSKL